MERDLERAHNIEKNSLEENQERARYKEQQFVDQCRTAVTVTHDEFQKEELKKRENDRKRYVETARMIMKQNREKKRLQEDLGRVEKHFLYNIIPAYIAVSTQVLSITSMMHFVHSIFQTFVLGPCFATNNSSSYDLYYDLYSCCHAYSYILCRSKKQGTGAGTYITPMPAATCNRFIMGRYFNMS